MSQLVPCASLLAVEACWVRVAAAVLDSTFISVARVPVLVAWVSWVAVKVLEWPVRSLSCFQTV